MIMPNIIQIEDFYAPELDVYARLNENQLLNRANPSEGIFIAESPKVIERALESGCTPLSLLMEKRHIETEAKEILTKIGSIPVFVAELKVLTKLTGFPLTRGMLCAMRRPSPLSVEEICRDAKRIAVLEDVVNPTNVGAIIRSAAALSMDAVLLTPASSDPLYRRAIRVSMGTVFQVPWAYLSEQGIAELHRYGFQTAALALKEDTISIDSPVLKSIDKLALVLGTEGEGLKNDTIEACDYSVKIPMSHGVDSLNVAAASAVAFWEINKGGTTA